MAPVCADLLSRFSDAAPARSPSGRGAFGLAAIDARCDWTVTRGTQRSDRVYFCRVWERGKERDYLEGGPSKFYRSTLADALRGIVLAAEDRGWHRPQ